MMRSKVLEFDDVLRYLKMKPSTEAPPADTTAQVRMGSAWLPFGFP